MPRPPRLQLAGAIYHVTARGNRRVDIFMDDSDRRLFLALLERTVTRYGWRCHTYCLMKNHFHLVIETPEPNISDGMQFLAGLYAAAFNHRHGLSGHLFQGRFHTVVLKSDGQLLATVRYVLLNPVRAGLCERPGDWKWSSYGTIVQVDVRSFVHVGLLLGLFGRVGSQAREEFGRFVFDPPARAGQ
jgi:REP element-mobilizing transposase RayT